MLKKKYLTKICALGAALYALSNASLFAASDYNYNSTTTPTDKIMVFEQDDEKSAYTNHGFSRGDMSYLYSGKFDPSQVENISGDVEQVMRVQFPDQDCYLIAILKTRANNGKVAVNLGPVWFLEENGITVNEGDSLQVSGAKMRTNGRFVLIATEVTKNGKSLNLRDKEGTSLWGAPKAQKGNADCMKFEKKNKSFSLFN